MVANGIRAPQVFLTQDESQAAASAPSSGKASNDAQLNNNPIMFEEPENKANVALTRLLTNDELVEKGRPRKYPKYGLPKNAKALSDAKLQVIKNSQRAAQRYDRLKYAAELERRVEQGQDQAEAEQIVSARANAQAISEGRNGMSIDEFLEARRLRSSRPSQNLQLRSNFPSVAAHSAPLHFQARNVQLQKKPRSVATD